MKTSTFWVLTLFSYAFFPSYFVTIANTTEEKPPYLTKEFTLEENGKVNVTTSGGSITVLGQNGNAVKVQMFVKKSGGWFDNEEDIKEALENYEITIKKEGNTVLASAKRRSGDGWFSSNNVSISFKVFVPTKVNSNLKTSGGSITLSKVIGDQFLETSGGSLTLTSIRGNSKAHTSGGGIEIKNYKGNIDAHTSGGSIEVFEAKGVVKVNTSGGSINLNEVYGSIDANTSGGSIDANIKEVGKYVQLHTSGGSISATVPGGIGLDLDLHGNSVNTKLVNFNGESKKNKVVGKVNGGGAPVRLSTSGGSVNLNYM